MNESQTIYMINEILKKYNNTLRDLVEVSEIIEDLENLKDKLWRE